MTDQLLLRVREAADRLGISRATTYSLIQKGELRTVHIGASRRIPAEALVEFVRRREEQEAAATA